MKIQTHQTNTQVSGTDQAPRTFNIKANSVAFATLSSGLYNDKIRAIIRELACNAWDAHIMAGKPDVPFDIHLPTELEPFFRITDYGIGLSDADVMDLYCTYFSSNKSQSNDVVGAMGLGSKSPFCYTQTMDDPQGFTVVSRFEGMKRIYSAYVENGAPTIVHLSEEDTTEPNGLDVQFAVNTEDIWEFENKAKMALEFFTPAPNVNRENFQIPRANYAIKNKMWGLRAGRDSNGLRAIQGMVQYRVGSIDYSRMSREQQAVAGLPLDLFFPIGELSVAASRETLSNDQRTIGNILATLSNVHTDMINEARQMLDQCKTAWQARLQLQKILGSDTGSAIRSAYQDGFFYGQYTNFNLSKDAPALNELAYTALDAVYFTHSSRKKVYRYQCFNKYTPNERQAALLEIQANSNRARDFFKNVEVSESLVFIFNDLGEKGNERVVSRYVGHYVQNPNFGLPVCQSAYVFSPVDATKGPEAFDEFEKAVASLGHPTQILLSDVKAVVEPLLQAERAANKAAGPRRPRVTGVMVLTGNGRSRGYRQHSGWLRSAWSRVPAESLPAGNKFYIPTVKSVLIDPRFAFYDAKAFVDFLNAVKGSKLFPGIDADTKIYGLTEKSTALKNNPDEWVNILDYIAVSAKDIITEKIVSDLSCYLEKFSCSHDELLEGVLKHPVRFAGSPMLEFAEKLAESRDSFDERQATCLSEVIEKLTQVKLYKAVKTVGFEKLWSKLVVDHYPMLAVTTSGYSENKDVKFDKAVLGYIRVCDAQNASQKEGE